MPTPLTSISGIGPAMAEMLARAGIPDAETLRDWAVKGTSRRPFSCEARRMDGRILDVFGQEMPDNGFVISFTDVTAEREAARALRRLLGNP